MGHKRTFWDARAMSALPPKADIREPRTVSAKGKKLATAASLLIATVRLSRLQAVWGRADVWPVRHLRPEATPDRVIQPAPEAHLRLPGGSGTKRTVLAKSDTDDTTQRWGDIRPIPSACRTGLQNALGTTLDRRREPQRSPHMNKQMTLAEIDVPACGRSAMKFTGLDKFDT